MGRRMQMVMSSGTVVLGLYVALLGGGDMALFGWVVMVLGLVGLLAPMVLSRPRGG